MRLTEKQIQCLRDASTRNIDPFDYGSTTINRLKREGLIVVVVDGRKFYKATKEGLDFLNKAR